MIRTYQAIGSDDLRYTWQVDGLDPAGENFPGPKPCRDVLQISIEPVGLTADGVTGLLPRWRDLVNVDYSALDTTTFEADGAVTIGGVGYIVTDLANRYSGTTMGLTSGKGLRLPAPVAGVVGANRFSDYFDLARIHYPLPDQIVNGVPVRAFMRLHSQESGGSSNLCPNLALCYPSATSICIQVAMLKGLSGETPVTATQMSYRQRVDSGTVSATASDKSVAAGSNIIGIWAPNGVGSTKPTEVSVGRETDTPIADPRTVPTVVSSAGLADSGSDPATRGQAQNWCVTMALSAVTSYGVNCYIDRFRVQAFY